MWSSPARASVARMTFALSILLAVAGCDRRHPPGRIAPATPLQTAVEPGVAHHAHGAYDIAPLAHFHIEARVLSATRYWTDRESQLAPVDLALGWGPMSDSSVLDHISIGQMSRFYTWSEHDAPGHAPIEQDDIEAFSANMHIIPADDRVRAALLRVHKGDLVTIDGDLVQVQAPDGWAWASSLTRLDTGDGACEVIWAEKLEIR